MDEASADDPAPDNNPAAPREGFSSSLPWRNAGPGRLRLAALAPRLAGRAAKPGSKARNSGRPGLDVDDHIRHVIREESAATLGRAGTLLQEAVAALADFDSSRAGDPFRAGDRKGDRGPTQDPAGEAIGLIDRPGSDGERSGRRPLLIAAAAALWQYVVQREAMGLTSHHSLEQIYGVTPELWSLMGSAEVVHRKCGQ